MTTFEPPPPDWEKLFAAAHAAREQAHAPYSKFRVGAALWLADGSIVPGANVENASYGLSMCAERNAVGRAVLEGKARPFAVAIVADSASPVPPCGMCRQVLAEFAGMELPVRSRNLAGIESRYTLGELLPHAFTKSFL